MVLRRRMGGGGDEGGAPADVYQMRQQMFAIGDDFWIQTGGGRRAFKVDGKALRVRQTLILETPDGREVYKIQEKLLTVRDKMDIEGPAGPVATVTKALISPLRERYTVSLSSGGEWNVQGNITDHNYEISSDQGKIAEVSKRWFRIADTYGIEVSPGQDDALVLAIAIVVDQISHKAR